MTTLTGTGVLTRLVLRRDRVQLPVWILAVVATVAATIGAFDDLYPDPMGRAAFAASIRVNLVFRALYGPLFNAETNGGLTAWRLSTFGAVILGLMSVFLIVRHTRQEEESGRAELVGAAAIGRSAPLAAVGVVALAANLIAGLLSVVVLVGSGQDVAGAVAFGSALAGSGLVFAGVAAVAAQLTETARAATTLAAGAVGVAFMVRVIGDGADGPTWLSWWSPIGWSELVRAFDENRFWVLGLDVVTAVVLGAVATLLHRRRDLGSGILRSRTGPASAPRSLAGPLSLGWRLERGSLLGWAVSFGLLGGVFGSLTGSLGQLVDSSPQIAEILRRVGGPGALIDSYVSGVLGIVALVAAAYGIAAALRLRSAETGVLIEPVLATGVSRLRLLAAHAVFVFLAPALLMLLAGLATGIAADLALDDGAAHLPAVLAGAALQVPAIWVLSGFATLLFGVLPRWSTAGWTALAVCGLLALIGPVMNLPSPILDVSPFSAVPRIMGDATVPVTPVLVLIAVAVALTVAGFAGFRRRDIG